MYLAQVRRGGLDVQAGSVLYFGAGVAVAFDTFSGNEGDGGLWGLGEVVGAGEGYVDYGHGCFVSSFQVMEMDWTLLECVRA